MSPNGLLGPQFKALHYIKVNHREGDDDVVMMDVYHTIKKGIVFAE